MSLLKDCGERDGGAEGHQTGTASWGTAACGLPVLEPRRVLHTLQSGTGVEVNSDGTNFTPEV